MNRELYIFLIAMYLLIIMVRLGRVANYLLQILEVLK